MENFHGCGKWKRKREKILKRDEYICQECKRYGRHDADGMPIKATVVHHIKEYEQYPELGLEDSNLISLCAGCHNKKHPDRAKIRGHPPHHPKMKK